ncbi:hypothetical protein ACWGK1_20260 [Streptomyces wedmorensis]
MTLEALVREHATGHDLANVLASLAVVRDATEALRVSSDRA